MYLKDLTIQKVSCILYVSDTKRIEKRWLKVRLSFKEKRNKVRFDSKGVRIAVGLAEISIRKLENGERDPSINTAVKISKALNSNMEEIFPDIFLDISDTKCI